jgi:fused signal recognition particle receptor
MEGVYVVLGLGKRKLEESLTKTRRGFFGQVMQLLGANDITDETWEDLEALLIQADVGVETTIGLVERLRERANQEHIMQARRLREVLREELLLLLPSDVPRDDLAPRLLTVILIVGVNGSGKTTTIAKLARYYRGKGCGYLSCRGDRPTEAVGRAGRSRRYRAHPRSRPWRGGI